MAHAVGDDGPRFRRSMAGYQSEGIEEMHVLFRQSGRVPRAIQQTLELGPFRGSEAYLECQMRASARSGIGDPALLKNDPACRFVGHDLPSFLSDFCTVI